MSAHNVISDISAAIGNTDGGGTGLVVSSDAPPSGQPGYVRGCLYVRTGATMGLYRNTGTVSSCTFTAFASV